MKKQCLSMQLCGLAIGVAGALAPFATAQATDQPMMQERFQQELPMELYTGFVTDSSDEVRGAQGPIRDDTAIVAENPAAQAWDASGKTTLILP